MSMRPISASDASTLGYLARFPDIEPEDRDRLLSQLCDDARAIAKVLLGDVAGASPEVIEKAAALKQWALSERSRA